MIHKLLIEHLAHKAKNLVETQIDVFREWHRQLNKAPKDIEELCSDEPNAL